MGVAAGAGSGGVSRGRGDATLTYGDETPGRTDQFEAKTLPQAEYLDIESSGVLGVGAAQPEVNAIGEGAGLTEVGASAGRTAWRRRLAPRHRRAVGTFFTRDASKD